MTRKSPSIATILVLSDRGEQVGSEETRKNKSSGDFDLSDILLNLGLALEMLDVSKTSVANLLGVKERRKDKLLHACSLASIGDSLSLSNLAISAVGFPVVCHEEDSVSVFDGGSDLFGCVHVGLESQLEFCEEC
ncbi:hypothetical protein HG531_013513 [Fusarium graminearum]|nr:hypothetical protein HG531_013513 [Fusarium graminearum]